MHSFFNILVVSALIVSPSLSAPITLLPIEKIQGDVKSGSFIVQLKDGVAQNPVLDWLTKQLGTNSAITHAWDPTFVNGFAGTFDPVVLNLLRLSPDVKQISEDGIMSIASTTTQADAPWGLARISQTAKLANQNARQMNFKYKYDSSAGQGVDIYVVDTGIYTGHSDFGGRARWGTTSCRGCANADGNGHGTHVAGSAGGSRWGVAKAANLIAVKVLPDSGNGPTSDIISGLDWVASKAKSSGRPSIATISIGGPTDRALDSAVAALTRAGIHVTVAAGNDGVDASNTSPAREPSAITIGASNIADARGTGWGPHNKASNYGAVVDLFAPGEDITSAGIRSSTDTAVMTGTSMATPHVAGLVAYLISVNGNSSPSSIKSTLKSMSTKDVLSNIPPGTANVLARNDIS